MVAHEGRRWLDRTLSALASQSRRPDEVLGVDAGSADSSGDVLSAHLPHVVTTEPCSGLLDSVRAGLLSRDAERLAPGGEPGGDRAAAGATEARAEWVWLLHDDSAPAPDALERLLEAVEVAPSVAVAGCKQRSWDDADRLLQTGFTVSRLGRPITGVEAGDVDQGQTDDREDVLAVGTAGMLVRRDVWEALDGGDPATPLVGDDLDLCRRARLAGHRVVVVPSAVVAHADATRAGLRRSALGTRPPWWVARRATVHRRLVDAPSWWLPVTVLTVLAGGVLRLLARTAAKEPRRAVGELSVVLAALARPDQVWWARRRLARTRAVSRRSLAPLLASQRDVARWHRDRWQRRRLLRAAGAAPVAAAPATPGGWRLPAALVVALAAVSGLALHRLVGPGPVSGGALGAPPGDLGALWESARSPWTAAGLGAAGPPDAFLTTLAVLSLPFGGPSAAVPALLLLAVPLAALGAWVAAGQATRSAWLRGWAALVWAAAAPLLTALDDGRLGAVVAHVALPWAALAVARAVSAPTTRRAWTAAAAGGLAFSVVATAAPVLLPAGLLCLLVVAVVAARGARTRSLALLATAVPALALSGPQLAAAVADPRLLVSGPGLPLAAAAPDGWLLLLGQPSDLRGWPLVPAEVAGLGAVAGGGVLLALAAASLLRSGPRGRAVRAGWLVAVAGLAAALAASRVVVGVDAAGTVRGWAGAGTSLVVAGLLVAALAAADGVGRRVRGHRFGWRGACAGLLAAVAVLAPVGALAAWTTGQLGGGPVTRGAVAELPAVAADAAASPDGTRTLVLRAAADGTVAAGLARAGTQSLDSVSSADAARGLAGGLGDAVPAPADPAQEALGDAVAVLVSGTQDPRPALADLGVGYVLLLGVGEPAAAPVSADGLDGVEGLARAGEVEAGVLWRVTPLRGDGPEAVGRAAAARLLSGDGTPLAVLPTDRGEVRGTVPVGAPDRVLVLAERADSGWHAYVDHRRLEPVVHAGWAQGFALGDESGDVVVRFEQPGWDAWSWAQVAVVALTVLLAVPVGSGARRGVRR